MESEDKRIHLASEHQFKVAWERGGSFDDKGVWRFNRKAEEHVKGIIGKIFEMDAKKIVWVNTGCFIESNSTRKQTFSRREVRLIELGRTDGSIDLQVVRRQQMDTADYIDEGVDDDRAGKGGKGYARNWSDQRSLIDADEKAEQYSNFQRLGREQAERFGMHTLPFRSFDIVETYKGLRKSVEGTSIRAFYVVRPYLHGDATDKVTVEQLRDQSVALAMAALLGHAAAYNTVIGRADPANGMMIADGDEAFCDFVEGIPREIVVMDPTGCFEDYRSSFSEMIPWLKKKASRFTSNNHTTDIFWNCFMGSYSRIHDKVLADERGANKLRELFNAPSGLPNDQLYRRSLHYGSGLHDDGTPRNRNDWVLRRVKSTPPQELPVIIKKNVPEFNYVPLDQTLKTANGM
jgi:hypothetical protein